MFTVKNKKILTESAPSTQNLGKEFAKSLKYESGLVVIGLKGDLGSGKTTFLQGFAKGLNIKAKILSPTFVILKRFKTKKGNFYHIDCYRLKDGKDLLSLGFKNILLPGNVIAIEWPERVKDVLPKNTTFLDFKFINENKREITFE